MSKLSVTEQSRRGVLIVGRPQTAPAWHTWSAVHDLRCVEAADVPAALEQLSRMSPIALVVASTLDEPLLSDFCERVRRHDAFRYAPIVASGPGDEALHRRSRAAGVDAYLPVGDATSELHIRHRIKLALELETVAKRRMRARPQGPQRRRSDRAQGLAATPGTTA
jgi:hypothetical protein